MRAIDADALMRAMYERAFETDGDTMWQSGCWVRYRAIEEVVKEQPTIEPRMKGKWIRLEGDSRFMCSVCRWKENVPTCNGEPTIWDYCPSCGAGMRGEQNGQ